MNRLVDEKSPYLQQHASNPVDWYPWGPEAFAAARDQKKPIFLSIGYSTCHWCHVMAHESFENPEIAAVMNARYINIKVDREERPDIDAVYMSAVQALTGSGGWPMSVWLTHDLKPFYGGTYFPPEDRWGRPGFPSVMEQLADVFANEPERVTEAATHMADFLRQTPVSTGSLPASAETDDAVYRSLEASFDSRSGGFSPAPKFPMPVYLEFLLDYHERTGRQKALEMATFTFRKMASGGLYDHIGGGFSRYSTDDKWLVPHFEKMLYDNAQLIRSGAALWAVTGDDDIRRAVAGTVEYLLRDLRHAEGGFFSGEDADSEGKEGTFYLWMLTDFRRLLGDDAQAVAAHFGVTVEGNFHDPHSNETGKNVISIVAPPPPGVDIDAVRQQLFQERNRRPRPHRDEKVITEWNGLAISALTRAGFSMNRSEWISAAEKATDFILASLYDRSHRTLYRRWRDGYRAIEGQLGDHAMLVEALIELFEVTGNPERLEMAIELHDLQNEIFLDPKGGYFMGRASEEMFVRPKEDGDNVIPSGNAVAIGNGLRLAVLTGEARFRVSAETAINFFAQPLRSRAYSLSRMASCLAWIEGRTKEIVITGPETDEETVAMIDLLRRSRPRGSVFIQLHHGRWAEEIQRLVPRTALLRSATPGPAAYVCRQFACLAPSPTAASFASALRA